MTDDENAQPGRPLVSVVIPVFGDEDGLRACLDALGAQTYPADRIEVIVVDNGSIPPVRIRADPDGRVRLLREEREGAYAARNRGIESSRGGILAFTDADCVPSPRWIERGARALIARPDCGIVAGRIRVTFGDPSRPTPVELYESLFEHDQERYVARDRFGATANLFTRRRVFDAVGLFDGCLRSGGDLEWGRRVHAAGYRIVHDAGASVEHPARRTLGSVLARKRRIAGGHHAMLAAGSCPPGVAPPPSRWFLPPVRRLVRVLTDRRVAGTLRRASVMGVAVLDQWTYGMERSALALGGRPRR